MTLFFAIKSSSSSSSLAATLATVVGSKKREEKKKGEMHDGWGAREEERERAPYKNAISAGGTRANYSIPFFSPFFLFCLHPPLGRREEGRLGKRRSTPAVAPTANGEIMIKPTSFQWNDGNYRAGCSRIPVFVHYSEAAYKCLARKVRSR